jgi:hypothetical protein
MGHVLEQLRGLHKIKHDNRAAISSAALTARAAAC